MAKQPGRSRLFGTKYARCAQLWSLNYLVRVSLFIEYRCLFIPQASLRVAVREKRVSSVKDGELDGGSFSASFDTWPNVGIVYCSALPEVFGIPRCANRTADFRVLQKTAGHVQNKQVYY